MLELSLLGIAMEGDEGGGGGGKDAVSLDVDSGRSTGQSAATTREGGRWEWGGWG